MKYDNLYFESFLMEKQFNSWISKLTLYKYYELFNSIIASDIIDYHEVKSFTPQNVKRFLQSLFISKNLSPATYNTYRKNLKCFCGYLLKEWYIDKNPLNDIPKMREEKKLLTCYTEKEVNLINYSINHLFDLSSFIWLRNFAIVKTMLFSGLRRKEILEIKSTDVVLNSENPYFVVKKSKWNKSRLVPIPDVLATILLKYQTLFENGEYSDLFFCSLSGKKLQARDLYRVIKKIEEKTGFHLTLHKFRHTFATELVKNNFNLFSISEILGHSSIETTKIYLNSDCSLLQKQLSGIRLYAN